MTALIIDTDIGTDADDAIAIAYAIRSFIHVPLITTVHGDTVLRARIATQLVRDFNGDARVVAGESEPLRQKHIFRSGLEDTLYAASIEPTTIASGASEALCDTIDQYKGNVCLAAIGPLTNVARAMLYDESITRKLERIYVMGNAILTPDAFHLNYRAHNFKVDPEAADVVFASGVPITLITTEVAKRSAFRAEDLAKLAASNHPGLNYIARSAEVGMHFVGYEQAHLYDPLAVHHHMDRDCTEQKHYGTTSITTSAPKGFAQRVLEIIMR